jgi:hypothetical protein
MAPQKWLTGEQAQHIHHVLKTPKRRELFHAMLIEVAAGRWEELAPEDARGLYHIRWRATRRTPDIHRQHHPRQGRTYDELVFVNLCTPTSVLVSRFTDLAGGRGAYDVTLARALAIVRDPVAALGLDPVPVLRWGLVWADGCALSEPLRWDTEAEVAPAGQERVVPGHAARHAGCDGAVALDSALNVVECRACGAREIRGRDILFHPWRAELFEEIPPAAPDS